MRCGELSPGQCHVQGASLPAPPQQEAPAPSAQSPGPGSHLDPSRRDRPSAQVP